MEQIPVLHVRGDNYSVGYAIGHTFKTFILELLDEWDFYKNIALPLYSTVAGQQSYNNCLDLCKRKFPQYVEEIRGMAEGAGVAFYKLFTLHVPTIMSASAENKTINSHNDCGCTTIMCNNKAIILAHTEDCWPEIQDKMYIVCAEITDKNGKKLEKFSVLCYAAHLPGYTMGFNEHGMVHSMNTVDAKQNNDNGSPREFLARALLGTSTLDEVLTILHDTGEGTANGFSLNIHFSKQSGPPLMYNIEVGPGQNGKAESEIDVHRLQAGEFSAHCNKYLRLNVPGDSCSWPSTLHRHQAIEKHGNLDSLQTIKEILSDESDPDYPIFRRGTELDHGRTAVVGIFELQRLKWSIYVKPPLSAKPVAVIDMSL